MSAASVYTHDRAIEAMVKLGFDLTGLTPCSKDTRGALCLTVDSVNLPARETFVFEGKDEALRNLYSQCISHPKVVHFEVV